MTTATGTRRAARLAASTPTGRSREGGPVSGLLLCALAGVVAAAAGALLWGAVVALTHLQVGYVAVAVGLLVGAVMAATATPARALVPTAAVLAVAGSLAGSSLQSLVVQAHLLKLSTANAAGQVAAHPILAWNVMADYWRPVDAVLWAVSAVAAALTVRRAVRRLQAGRAAAERSRAARAARASEPAPRVRTADLPPAWSRQRALPQEPATGRPATARPAAVPMTQATRVVPRTEATRAVAVARAAQAGRPAAPVPPAAAQPIAVRTAVARPAVVQPAIARAAALQSGGYPHGVQAEGQVRPPAPEDDLGHGPEPGPAYGPGGPVQVQWWGADETVTLQGEQRMRAQSRAAQPPR